MIQFSVKNPLIVNLILLIILVQGVLAWQSMPQEMFPTFERNVIQVSTAYPGASPEEVEREITIPIEAALDGLSDVDSVTSTSRESVSAISYKLQEGANVEELMREMRSLVDSIENFPEDAELPMVSRSKPRFPVISLAVHGEVPMPVLYEQADVLRRELAVLPGVSAVSIAGRRAWEMWVEADPHRLAARGVGLSELRSALRGNLRDTPSGTIRATEGDILLRGLGSESVEAIGAIAVRSNDSGGQLLVRDLADVSVQLEETQTIARFNGWPSVNMTVAKAADASTFTVRDRVEDVAARAQLAPGVQVTLFADMSRPIDARISTVQASGLIALILLLIALYFMLDLRMALITAAGIPVALLVAVGVMAATGQTVNLISMFAFLIVLGLVVDDAIVISENTYRHLEAGHDSRSAAYVGANEVLWPLVISVCTTIAAFLPILSIGGTMGKFVAIIPLVVVAALAGSLLEAFLILPSHAAEVFHNHKVEHVTSRWEHIVDRYQHVLSWSLHNRYLVAACTVGILLVTLAYMDTRMTYTQFADSERGDFVLAVEGPPAAGIEETNALAAVIEREILETVEPHEIDSLQTNVGVRVIDGSPQIGSNYAQFSVSLAEAAPEGFIEAYVNPIMQLDFSEQGTRTRRTEDIMDALRDALRSIPGVERLSIQRPQSGPGGNDIEIGVIGPDLDQVRRYAEDMREYLARLAGVEDARLNLDPGKAEYQYTLNARGRELGLSQSDLGVAVRTGYQGDKVEYVSHDGDRVPVRLLYPTELRHSSAEFGRLPITTPQGVVYLDEVTDIQLTQGMSAVNRRDGRRMITVIADVDKEVTTPGLALGSLIRKFQPIFQNDYRYQITFLGERREAERSAADMIRSVFTALFLIFLLLVALFRSVQDPLVVMASIPFSAIGVVIGHVVTGLHLQFLSLVGLLALMGIVVNDSLILINFIKRMRGRGVPRLEAVVLGGRSRFRCILLTTITTFLGVSPLIFFATGQTLMLKPMAVSLGFGLVFASALILIAVPCFYLVADDAQAAVARMFRQARSWVGARVPRSEGT